MHLVCFLSLSLPPSVRPSLRPSLPLQISDGTDVRAAALEIFMQVVDISPYLVRDFIMQEAKNHDDKEVGSRKMFIE